MACLRLRKEAQGIAAAATTSVISPRQERAGTSRFLQFTCFTGTNVQILTLEARDAQTSSPSAEKKVEQAPINLNDFPSLAGSAPVVGAYR